MILRTRYNSKEIEVFLIIIIEFGILLSRVFCTENRDFILGILKKVVDFLSKIFWFSAEKPGP